jgi:hypothetical protein
MRPGQARAPGCPGQVRHPAQRARPIGRRTRHGRTAPAARRGPPTRSLTAVIFSRASAMAGAGQRDTDMSFGGHLRTLRQEAGLSGAELARRASMPVSTWCNWENDRGSPRRTRLPPAGGGAEGAGQAACPAVGRPGGGGSETRLARGGGSPGPSPPRGRRLHYPQLRLRQGARRGGRPGRSGWLPHPSLRRLGSRQPALGPPEVPRRPPSLSVFDVVVDGEAQPVVQS